MWVWNREQYKWKIKSKAHASYHEWGDLIWSDTDLCPTYALGNAGYCISVKTSFLYKCVMQKKPNQRNLAMYPMASPWQHIDAHATYILIGRQTAFAFPALELKGRPRGSWLQWMVLGFKRGNHSSRFVQGKAEADQGAPSERRALCSCGGRLVKPRPGCWRVSSEAKKPHGGTFAGLSKSSCRAVGATRRQS